MLFAPSAATPATASRPTRNYEGHGRAFSFHLGFERATNGARRGWGTPGARYGGDCVREGPFRHHSGASGCETALFSHGSASWAQNWRRRARLVRNPVRSPRSGAVFSPEGRFPPDSAAAGFCCRATKSHRYTFVVRTCIDLGASQIRSRMCIEIHVRNVSSAALLGTKNGSPFPGTRERSWCRRRDLNPHDLLVSH